MIENLLGIPDKAEQEEAEIAALEEELALMEQQLTIREKQENLLRKESRDLDKQIESYETSAIEEVAAIEDSVNSAVVKTYREMQQALEAVTFALESSLHQLNKLSQE